MKKRVFTLFLALLIFAALTVTAFADGGYQGNYVIDTTGLLTAEQAESLEAAAKECSESSGCGLYLVIVDDYKSYTGNSSDMDGAISIYESNNFGLGSEKSGVMLMMSMDDRHMYLLCNGDGSRAMSASENTDLRSELKEYFENDQWYKGFKFYMENASKHIYVNAIENNRKLDNSFYSSYIMKTRLIGVGACILIGLIIAAVVTLLLKLQLRSVAQKTEADRYIGGSGLRLNASRDRFTHTTVSRVYDPPSKSSNSNSSSSSGSGGYSGGGDDF